MARDFINDLLIEPTPVDAVYADIMLYGEDYWKSLDDSEFLLHYGITKHQFMHETGLGFAADKQEIFNVMVNEPMSALNVDQIIHDFANERAAHNGSKPIDENKSESTPSPQPQEKASAESSAPKTLQSAESAANNNAAPKKEPVAKPNKTIHITPKKGPEYKARKEFEQYKRDLLLNIRGSMARRSINLREKALNRKIDEGGISAGTPEWLELVKEFFPDAPLSPSVESRNNGKNSETEKPEFGQVENQLVYAGQETADTTETKNEEKAVETPQAAQANTSSNSDAAPKEAPTAEQTTTPAGENAQQAAAPNGGGAGGGEAETVSNQAVDKSSTDGFAKSLNAVGPVQFIDEMKTASGVAAGLQSAEKQTLKDEIPPIEQPTGLQVKPKDGKSADQAPSSQKGEAKEHEPKGDVKKQPEPKPHKEEGAKPQMSGTPIASQSSSDQPAKGEAVFVKSQIETLPSTDSGLSGEFGPRPQIDLKGQADPAQNQEFKAESDEQSAQEKSKADSESNKYYGEDDVFPSLEPEMHEAQFEMSETEQAAGAQLDDISNVPDEVKAGFDKHALEKLNNERSAEISKAEDAKSQMDTNMQAQKDLTDQKIKEETAKAQKDQEQAQQQAKSEVEKNRQGWQAENKKAVAEYDTKSATEKGKVENEIDSKVKQADKTIDAKISDAENKVKAEKKNAEAKAAQEKQKKEQKPKGFWDSLTDAVTSFFDAIKKALNTIFDALRALVKVVIDAAKKAVCAVIDAVKDAVKNAIKAFGAILKALVSVLLAAFPSIRDKFLSLIDRAVEAACALVDKLAEMLKKAVCFLLDVLGAALDAILAAYQKIYNMMLDALAFIAVGLVKIMKGIGNLVESAKQMPSNFWGQVSEEMLGVDVTKPLPNEAPMITDNNQMAEQMLNSGAISEAEKGIIDKPVMSENDVDVEPATDFQLDPVLMQQLSSMPDGSEMDFDTDEGGKEEVDKMKEEAMSGGQESAGVSPEASTPSPTTETQQTSTEPGQVGPFSGPGERIAYLAGQMKDGITKWFNDNMVMIIGGLVLGIAGVIAANVITGGAIMATLPLLMQIIGALFAAQAIANATGYFGTFLSQGFQGNISAGAVALARATAIIVIELVTSLLFAGKGAIKGAKTAIKTVAKQGGKGALKTGARAAKGAAVSTVKNTAKAVVELGGVAKQGAKAALKNGKLAIQGIKNGFGKGAKSFGALAKSIASKMKLKKVKISRTKRWFRIMGLFNPWVLLASGEIKKVNKSEIGDASVGSKLKLNGENAVYIGKHKPNISSAKSKEFLESGFDIEQISKLANSKKGIEIAEILRNKNGFNADEILDLVEKANKFGLDEQLERILKSGKLENPEKLKKILSEFDEANPKLGNYHELNISDDITRKGRKAEFDTQGDVVDLDDMIVYQAKRVESDKASAVFENIQSADNQLAHMNSSGTAVKPQGIEEPMVGFKRYANIDIHNTSNELFNLNRRQLLTRLNKAVDDLLITFNPSPLGDGLATHKIIIKNGNGTFEFTIKGGRLI